MQDDSDSGKSKLLRDTGLSQYRVGGVSGEDFAVHRETPFFAWPLEVTSMHTKYLLQGRSVTGHQKVRTPLSSCWYSTWKSAVRPVTAPFNSNNSGISVLSF